MKYNLLELEKLKDSFEEKEKNYDNILKNYIENMAPLFKFGLNKEDIYDINEKLVKMKNLYMNLKNATDKYIKDLKSLENKLINESSSILLPFDFDFGSGKSNFKEIETYDLDLQIINFEKIDEICKKIDEKTLFIEKEIKTLINSKYNDENTLNYFNNMNQIVTSLNDFTRFARYAKDEYKKLENSYVNSINSLKE